jgi:hypothetical protein
VKLEFSRQIFEKKVDIHNFMKTSPAGAEFFHADGQTDMTKLIVTFRNFVNAPENHRNSGELTPEPRFELVTSKNEVGA